jgi:hypothetical protein
VNCTESSKRTQEVPDSIDVFWKSEPKSNPPDT